VYTAKLWSVGRNDMELWKKRHGALEETTWSFGRNGMELWKKRHGTFEETTRY
jgi:hypothetical protein